MDTKVCNKCKIKKNLNDFHKCKKGFKGHKANCKKCRSIKFREENLNRKYIDPNSYSGTKVCFKCKIEKDLNDFYKYQRGVKGRETYCKKCKSDKFKKEYRNRKYVDVDSFNGTKMCFKCKKEKDLNDFHKDKNGIKGCVTNCKKCANNICKEKYKNDENFRKRSKKSNKKYKHSKKGKETIKKHSNKIENKLASYMRTRIWQICSMNKLNKNGQHTFDILGYSSAELVKHLEKQFLSGMTWKNHGSKWHIDHIIPISKWSLKNVNSFEFKKCCSLENLRPMWTKDNLEKGNSLCWDLENPNKEYPLPEIINWFYRYRYKNIKINKDLIRKGNK